MYKIIRADERHRRDINRLIREANTGSGLSDNEPVKNLWVIRNNDGKVIACCGLDFYNDTAILNTLVVAKKYQRRGIGSHLIRHRLKLAGKSGAKIAALCTMFYTFHVYRKHGFETCKRKNLPESIKNYPQFTAKRYKKCAVMLIKI
ncbi:MAG: GNAT family N-acetyltransferase [Candidatus Taylorbacteria bacterium]|nr:GNAT family N-acetyltransferase [Candidatus Taylorbacteria bacterium]